MLIRQAYAVRAFSLQFLPKRCCYLDSFSLLCFWNHSFVFFFTKFPLVSRLWWWGRWGIYKLGLLSMGINNNNGNIVLLSILQQWLTKLIVIILVIKAAELWIYHRLPEEAFSELSWELSSFWLVIIVTSLIGRQLIGLSSFLKGDRNFYTTILKLCWLTFLLTGRSNNWPTQMIVLQSSYF